jgi:Domain of unknown function (DUF4145)
VSEIKLSRKQKCLHCGNFAPMKVLESVNAVESFQEPIEGLQWIDTMDWEAGYIYWLLECFSCSKITLERQGYHSEMDPEGIEGPFDILYPPQSEQPSGLPSEISKAYDAALAVKEKDAGFFAILLGRLLERICKERQATGINLHQRLESVALNSKLPADFLELAHGLKNFRNFAAHDSAEELRGEDAPMLESLCRVVLIYLYTAPKLVEQAKKRLDELKTKLPNG